MFTGLTADSGADVARHIVLALATVIVALFSQSMTMFFFIGTGKEIKDSAKGTPEEKGVVDETKSYKAKVFPAALYSMLVVMTAFIIGGGVHTGSVPSWVHLLLSIASLLMFGRAYWIELHAMEKNANLMQKYLSDE